MRVEVTWGDILAGVRGDPYRCALARALRRAGIDQAVRIDYAVGPSAVSMASFDGVRESVKLPEIALKFLWRFDGPFHLLRCRPFSFELNLPKKSEIVQESRAVMPEIDFMHACTGAARK